MTPRNINRKELAVTHRVRVTQEPTVVREITDAELLDLSRQGLIHSFEHTVEALAIVPEGFKTEAKWSAPKRGDGIVTPAPDVATTLTDIKGE